MGGSRERIKTCTQEIKRARLVAGKVGERTARVPGNLGRAVRGANRTRRAQTVCGAVDGAGWLCLLSPVSGVCKAKTAFDRTINHLPKKNDQKET